MQSNAAEKITTGICAVILDMPMYYYKSQELPAEWPSVATRIIPTRASKTYLQVRLEQIPTDIAVVLVTAEGHFSSLEAFLLQNGYFGRDPATVQLCPTASSYLLDSFSGDFVRDLKDKRIRVSGGSFSALIQLFAHGLVGDPLGTRIKHLQVSFMENWGATFDRAFLGILSLQETSLLAEVKAWKGEEGPLALNMGDKPQLFERGEIADDAYASLRLRRDLVGGFCTNTYWIEIERLLDAVSPSRQEISAPENIEHLLAKLEQHAGSLFLSRIYQGRRVIYSDTRLSVLTHFLETQFVEVPETRYTHVPPSNQ